MGKQVTKAELLGMLHQTQDGSLCYLHNNILLSSLDETKSEIIRAEGPCTYIVKWEEKELFNVTIWRVGVSIQYSSVRDRRRQDLPLGTLTGDDYHRSRKTGPHFTGPYSTGPFFAGPPFYGNVDVWHNRKKLHSRGSVEGKTFAKFREIMVIR